MEKIQITISSVLNDLANSMSREEIRDKYALTNAQLKQLFQHPKLKGRKTKQVNVLFEIVDDVTPEVVEVAEVTEVTPVVNDITNPTEEEVESIEVEDSIFN
jgi:hypothetical protein